ncbi:MAG: type II secretion system F family protein [Candidatus Omnitrophica bacterium]|nr:type II secretion system F family protein [Candidatus Omnitrophota bacterium]
MIYKYRAKKGPQDIVDGTIEANNEKEAIEKISQMGCLPLRIERFNPDASESDLTSQVKLRGRIRSRQITIFSRQLASLLRSGVPILNALNIIREQSENPHLKHIIRIIHNEVKEGATFSAVLAKYPHIFPNLYVAMVRAGEDAGSLPETLLKIADYRAKQEELLSRFRMSMAYPILMAIVGLSTVIFMLTFVMPRMMRIFVNLGEKLPLPTRILISISKGLCSSWLWIILILVIIILVIKRQAKTKAGKLSLSIFALHIPIVGNLILKTELARFSRTLELLIKNGISILKAIDIAIPVLENEVIKNQLRQSYKQLEQGGSFGRSLKSSKVFPLFMSNLITVGEESGKLDEALAETASIYERDTDEAMKVMATLIEPLMILGMGIVVGFIVVAMLLPIFEINVMAR